MVWNMTGVVKATVKFMSQLETVSFGRLVSLYGTHLTADEIDIPLARMSKGKTSAETTQANGPQVTANVAMYK
jgi:hypothetical protein